MRTLTWLVWWVFVDILCPIIRIAMVVVATVTYSSGLP